jgi:hypothetical protein
MSVRWRRARIARRAGCLLTFGTTSRRQTPTGPSAEPVAAVGVADTTGRHRDETVDTARPEPAGTPTNFLELRVFGLQRSGNHAIIEWILDQHAGKRTCFLNNVGHGDQDPFTTTRQIALEGFGSNSDVEGVRRAHKDLLIYSYEDDLSRMRQGATLIDAMHDESFAEQRIRYVGDSEHRMNVIVLRDAFNFFASRLKKLDALTGTQDLEAIKESWKAMAKRALQMRRDFAGEEFWISYNAWVSDEGYRRGLSKRLFGQFSDASLVYVSGHGGGSSFDSEHGRLSLRVIRRKWRRLLDPKVYLHTGRHLRRLMAKDGRSMKVLDRWHEMRGEAVYCSLFRDHELLQLSERLFGTLPGARDFVKACGAENEVRAAQHLAASN